MKTCLDLMREAHEQKTSVQLAVDARRFFRLFPLTSSDRTFTAAELAPIFAALLPLDNFAAAAADHLAGAHAVREDAAGNKQHVVTLSEQVEVINLL